LRIRDLRHWEGDANGRWAIDSGAYTMLVGKNADHAERAGNQGTLTVQTDSHAGCHEPHCRARPAKLR
jgi:hypothetical protein